MYLKTQSNHLFLFDFFFFSLIGAANIFLLGSGSFISVINLPTGGIIDFYKSDILNLNYLLINIRLIRFTSSNESRNTLFLAF